MNYKLLANVNYQIKHIDRDSGIMKVHCALENKEKWDEELIVQRHSEEEGQAVYELHMDIKTEEQFALNFNGKEFEVFKYENQAEKRFNEFTEVNPSFKDLMEIELIDVDVYAVPPAHEIRRELLNQMGITMDERSLDERDGREQHYDGYGADMGFDFTYLI